MHTFPQRIQRRNGGRGFEGENVPVYYSDHLDSSLCEYFFQKRWNISNVLLGSWQSKETKRLLNTVGTLPYVIIRHHTSSYGLGFNRYRSKTLAHFRFNQAAICIFFCLKVGKEIRGLWKGPGPNLCLKWYRLKIIASFTLQGVRWLHFC